MSIWGALAVISSWVIVFIGLPFQIVKNYKQGNCKGLSPFLVCSTFYVYALWSIYAWKKPDRDWNLIASNTPGCGVAFVLLSQYIYYWLKNRKQRHGRERGKQR